MARRIACIIYKDNQEIGTFKSIIEATKFLEREIDGYLNEGVKLLLRGWVPPKNSQLHGYSAKHFK
ncbi:hypothetical protein [Metabacillus idriensis]|uniref:hypothetical protein n=1 Tax=Metabacillus idriensis TaxID=324768 RepID=UPI003D290BD1